VSHREAQRLLGVGQTGSTLEGVWKNRLTNNKKNDASIVIANVVLYLNTFMSTLTIQRNINPKINQTRTYGFQRLHLLAMQTHSSLGNVTSAVCNAAKEGSIEIRETHITLLFGHRTCISVTYCGLLLKYMDMLAVSGKLAKQLAISVHSVQRTDKNGLI